MATQPDRSRGQALLLVTFALFAMCGLLGLAVDLGWGYFVKKSAQAGTDAGALAGAYAALSLVGQSGPITCSTSGISCKSDPGVACDQSGNLKAACQYAEQEGFVAADVRVSAGTGTPPTGQPIPADYWVTVRSVKTIPQLFSAVLGNPTGVSSARSTAAITTVIVNGSLIALNRPGDPGNNPDVQINGGSGGSAGTLNLPGGLYAASPDNNKNDGIQAKSNSYQINGPIFEISPAANPNLNGNNTFLAQPDGPQFYDPMSGKGQPPLTSSALTSYAVINGNLNGTIYQVDASNNIVTMVSIGGSNVTLPPGNYFPAITAPCGKNCTPTAVAPLTSNPISTGGGTVTFSNGGSFGSYFFYGGLNVNGASVNMGPGQYVVVGGGLDNEGTLQDSSSATDGGQMLIITGTSTNSLTGTYPNITNNANNNLYPGLLTQVNSNAGLAQMLSSNEGLFGQTAFFKLQSGSGAGSSAPNGVNTTDGAPSNLAPFDGVVFWQDQANTPIKYTSNGSVDTSCGSINSPCLNPTNSSYSINPNIDFRALGVAVLGGVFYQPRGAGLTSNGHGTTADITGNLQIITGYFASSGGGGLNLQQPTVPLKRRVAALIE